MFYLLKIRIPLDAEVYDRWRTFAVMLSGIWKQPETTALNATISSFQGNDTLKSHRSDLSMVHACATGKHFLES